MARTRAAALVGAIRCIERQGTRKATMGDIAALGGIAKATLYNHFRTKEDVFTALVNDEVRRLEADCVALAAEDIVAALNLAAERVALHPAVRRLAHDEPGVLAAVAIPGSGGAWPVARMAARRALAAAGCEPSDAGVDLVVRWVASHLCDPGTPATRRSGARMLAQALFGRTSGPAVATG